MCKCQEPCPVCGATSKKGYPFTKTGIALCPEGMPYCQNHRPHESTKASNPTRTATPTKTPRPKKPKKPAEQN